MDSNGEEQFRLTEEQIEGTLLEDKVRISWDETQNSFVEMVWDSNTLDYVYGDPVDRIDKDSGQRGTFIRKFKKNGEKYIFEDSGVTIEDINIAGATHYTLGNGVKSHNGSGVSYKHQVEWFESD